MSKREEGYQAWLDGARWSTDCPYFHGSVDWRQWVLGLYEAKTIQYMRYEPACGKDMLQAWEQVDDPESPYYGGLKGVHSPVEEPAK